MTIFLLLLITTLSLCFGATIYLKMLRYKEEIFLKKNSIEHLENLNAELQFTLLMEEPLEEHPPGKVIKIA